MGFDSAAVREDFPVFSKDPSLVFLDSGASSQKPRQVIDRLTNYYSYEHSNIHRGVYPLSENATAAFENARATVAEFLSASTKEIVFTRGTTESINLVAMTWGRQNLDKESEVVLTVCEHHSNIVPWQILQKEIGFKIHYIPLDEDLRLNLDAARTFISERTKLISVAHVSNVLGTVHPLNDLISLARGVGAKVLVDGAQGVVHFDVDVKKLDADFYCFSGHKILGPTGVGVLYGKESLLQEMPPYHGGGDMIETVTLEGSTWAELPSKFEAGTPNIAGVIGLAEAITYLKRIDRKASLHHEVGLGKKASDIISSLDGFDVYVKKSEDWVGIVTFSHKSIHAHDFASWLGQKNICVRAGHHCAMPLLQVLGCGSTVRISPYIYNTERDIDASLAAIEEAVGIFS